MHITDPMDSVLSIYIHCTNIDHAVILVNFF
jgi:hypothetical protein